MIEVGDTVRLVRNDVNDRYFSARNWPFNVLMIVTQVDGYNREESDPYIHFQFEDSRVSGFSLGCAARRLEKMGGPW